MLVGRLRLELPAWLMTLLMVRAGLARRVSRLATRLGRSAAGCQSALAASVASPDSLDWRFSLAIKVIRS